MVALIGFALMISLGVIIACEALRLRDERNELQLQFDRFRVAFWRVVDERDNLKKENDQLYTMADSALHENDLARKHVIGTIADEAVKEAKENTNGKEET